MMKLPKRNKIALLCCMTLGLFLLSGCTKTSNRSEFDYFKLSPPQKEVALMNYDELLSTSKWSWHSKPSIHPDGNEVYWSKFYPSNQSIEIWRIAKTENTWQPAEKVEFTGIKGEVNCPVLSSDGNTLYFYELNGSQGTIYRANRIKSHWSDLSQVSIPIPDDTMISWGFSIADNQTLYFTLASLDGSGVQNLYYSEYQNGEYKEAIELTTLNSTSGVSLNPFIAPDESTILFESNREGGFGGNDIYISEKDASGNWKPPVNLGDTINTPSEEFGATLTPDGKFLIFESLRMGDKGYNPYWVQFDIDSYFNH